MKPATFITALATGTAVAGAGYWMVRRAREAPRALPPSYYIPIVTPIIDMPFAEDVLAVLERIAGDEVTLLLHTYGGSVTASVLIANALRNFPRSRAIVPYLASSGGTLIALNASELHMGRHAALSAVDPVLGGGLRARDVPHDEPSAALRSIASQYGDAVTDFLRQTLLRRRVQAPSIDVDRAMAAFLGDHAPHDWPISRAEVEHLGLPVGPAPLAWAQRVDEHRRRW